MADVDVRNEPDRQRFAAEVDGREAQLVYERRDDRLVLTHTEVPDELGGRGIGGALVAAAVEHAAAEGLAVEPRCPYARSWLDKHPDEASAVQVVTG